MGEMMRQHLPLPKNQCGVASRAAIFGALGRVRRSDQGTRICEPKWDTKRRLAIIHLGLTNGLMSIY